ncbi:carboxypeptidase-like regulatory domain-containing protein [Polaribacter sp. L3A8]|uniref:carboxypeptidase-like regulatory domain-containing protein n=1 Tax=Polaribacter sp. L3A8 TaxID=2686361 RepID=UPI00131C0055|nr:carboxypeptidase-like regulatory domain-containing protein [Polaribacter sp. L3A8]
MEKRLLQLLFVFLSFTALGQESKTLISGRIIDSLGIVKNANIINLKTKQGTFSFDDGRFQIYVSEGDTLQISNIQYSTKTIIINRKNITDKALIVTLKQSTYVLDEFELKRNHLIGQLAVDIKSVPKNEKIALLKSNMDFSNVDFSLKDHRIDANDRAKTKVVNTVANSYSGLNVGGIIGGLFSSKKFKKAQSRDKEFDRKKVFKDKILVEFGDTFFFDKLKIPKEKYFHFIEYCLPFDIEKMYAENRLLKIIEIFQQESASYLETLNKE